MKACIVGIQNLKHMTLISIYTDYFEKHNIQYDIIYIDKYGIDEKIGAENVFKLREFGTGIVNKISKTIKFIKYSTDILKKNNYDFVVIWREQTAVILAPFIARYYRGKYSVNIRDLLKANNLVSKRLLSYAIDNSAFNTISSEGFRKFLPEGNYIMLHSSNENIVSELEPAQKKHLDERICIMYLGTVRYYDYCKQVIDCFGNDSRFILKFIGQGALELKEYIQEKGYNNVDCIGAFDSSDTARFLKGADVINCAFGANNNQEKYLTPIRFYYSLYMQIPVLTTEGTWLNQLSEELSMNLTLPANINNLTNVSEEIYRQYHHINWEKMKVDVERYVSEITETNLKFVSVLENILGD